MQEQTATLCKMFVDRNIKYRFVKKRLSTSTRTSLAGHHFCFLKKLSGVRTLTTFYIAENDHRWVTFISLKTIGFYAAWFDRPEIDLAAQRSARLAGSTSCPVFCMAATTLKSRT